MCPVNVHWHLGAEHRNEGTFDIPGDDWIAEYDPRTARRYAGRQFLPRLRPLDANFTTQYEFEHCSEDNNQVCRGTGGMVTWRVDHGCHLISARAFDELCRVMKEQRVDTTLDTHPHGARETTDPANTTDVPMVSVTP